MLLGNNGIIRQAKEAADKANKDTEESQNEIDEMINKRYDE